MKRATGTSQQIRRGRQGLKIKIHWRGFIYHRTGVLDFLNFCFIFYHRRDIFINFVSFSHCSHVLWWQKHSLKLSGRWTTFWYLHNFLLPIKPYPLFPFLLKTPLNLIKLVTKKWLKIAMIHSHEMHTKSKACTMLCFSSPHYILTINCSRETLALRT